MTAVLANIPLTPESARDARDVIGDLADAWTDCDPRTMWALRLACLVIELWAEDSDR